MEISRILFSVVISILSIFAIFHLKALHDILEDIREIDESSVLKFYGFPLVLFLSVFYLIYNFVIV